MSLYILTHLLFAAPLVISTAILYIMANFYPQMEEPTLLKHIILFSALYSFSISLSNFTRHLGYTVVSSQVLFLFTCIQSCIKPFLYFGWGVSGNHEDGTPLHVPVTLLLESSSRATFLRS